MSNYGSVIRTQYDAPANGFVLNPYKSVSMFIYVACASTRPSYHLHALCSSEPIYSHDMHSLDSLVCMLSLHRAQHYCDGCCDASDPNSSGDNLFSSGCEIDLCCAKQGNVSVDDWGTGGVACGRVSGGIMVHRALPKSFTDALPTWSSMMPAEAQNSRGEACEKMRIKIQRKSWRTNVFFSSWDTEKQVLTLCWTAWPVERLMSELQFLDTQHNGLLDCVTFADDLNPFWKAKYSLSKQLHEGMAGDLKPLFDMVDPSKHLELMRGIRSTSLSFGSQIRYRFLPYECFPLRWGRWLHKGASAEERHAVPDEFFNRMKHCCRNREFDVPVFEYFNGDIAKMLVDKQFRQLLTVFCVAFRFTNMSMERLLALYQKWCVEGRPCAERVAATSFLGQILNEHKANGGDDPRWSSRTQLLEDGVQLRCSKKESKPQQCGTFVHFMAKAERDRKEAEAASLNKDAYKRWQAEKVAEWRDLDGLAKSLELHEVVPHNIAIG